MLIVASLSGIQDYLFDVRETGGGQARSLRHRSFRIQLYAECLALRLLDAVGLTYERLIFCAAAKVCIDATGVPDAVIRSLTHEAAAMQRSLLRETHGRLRLNLVIENADNTFREQFEHANRALIREKYRAFRPGLTADGVGWSDSSLIVAEPWDAKAEADRDAEIGRKLTVADWVTIERPGKDRAANIELLGLGVSLPREEPHASDDLLSCSNLQNPGKPPRDVPPELFHSRRLARHIPRDDGGLPVEFADLAQRGRGAPMLAVLKADVDSLGTTVSHVLRNAADGGPLRELSRALDEFFAGTLEAAKQRTGSPWSDIYTVFSGGDDLLAVGPWNVVLEFAGFVHAEFDRRFGATVPGQRTHEPLTLSAGIAVIKAKYPVHYAAEQAEEILHRAKSQQAPHASQPKDQCAAFGMVWKWRDHDAVLGSARQLADWVDAEVVERGWLHTLLELALLRRGDAGPDHAKIPPAMATSRLAYHVARNWPSADHRDPRAAEARRWIDRVLDEFDRFESTTFLDTIYLSAIVRYALLANRSGTSED